MTDLTPGKVREWLRWPFNSDQGRQLAEDWLRLTRLIASFQADNLANDHKVSTYGTVVVKLERECERLKAREDAVAHEAWGDGYDSGHVDTVKFGLPGADDTSCTANPYPKPDDPPRPQLSRDAVVECALGVVWDGSATVISAWDYENNAGARAMVEWLRTKARPAVAAALAKLEVE